MDRFRITGGVMFVFILAAMFAACQKQGTTTGSNTARGTLKSGQVIYIEGTVTMDQKQVSIGDDVPATATLATGPASECEIVFDKKNIIKIAENTRVTLDFSGQVKKLDLAQGSLASVLKNLNRLSNADAFQVRTNVAVMGVRGTVFYIRADKDTTYICDCNGVISLKDESGDNLQEVKAAHHLATVFSSENGQIVVSPGAMKYHTDADMAALAAKIGYSINWKVIDEH